jgi:GWxTD domain-containing protein
MKTSLQLLLACVVFVVPAALHAQLSSDALLQDGLLLEQSGEPEKALELWMNAPSELDIPSTAIGIEFIRLATEYNLKPYFQAATGMYTWGLSAEQVAPNKEALEKEVEFLKPLLDRRQWREWRSLVEEEDARIYAEVTTFWERQNPTPSTNYNERLIEHWSRIAWSREHFTKNKATVYGADDRARVYIKYGEPDIKREGVFDYNSSLARSIMEQVGAPDELEISIVNYHQYNEYEVWAYHNLETGQNRSTIFYFGKGGTGGYGEVQSVENFIENGAFSVGNRNNLFNKPSPITPGHILTILYHMQLTPVDMYFGMRYDEMMRQVDKSVMPGYGITPFDGLQRRNESRGEMIARQAQAETQQTRLDEEIEQIPVNVYQYRLLDEQGAPILITFLESRPQQAFLVDLSINQDSMYAAHDQVDEDEATAQVFGSYRLVHGLQLRDPAWKLLSGTRLEPNMILDFEDERTSSGSVFTVPHLGTGHTQVFYAELHNRHPASRPLRVTPFPDHLRGLGKVELLQPEPLRIEPGRMEASDIILGFEKREEIGENQLFPFVVSNEKKIPEGENLVIHFQLYNMSQDPGGISRFTMDYELRPVNFIGWSRRTADEFTLSLDFENDAPQFTETLEVQSTGLEVGRYELRLTFTDRGSGEVVERRVRFDVVPRRSAVFTELNGD